MKKLEIKETTNVKMDRILRQNGFLPADIDGKQGTRSFPDKIGILYQDQDLENLEDVGKIKTRKKWFGLIKETYVVRPILRRQYIGMIIGFGYGPEYSIQVFGRKYIEVIKKLGDAISVALNIPKPTIILAQEKSETELYQSDVYDAWD